MYTVVFGAMGYLVRLIPEKKPRRRCHSLRPSHKHGKASVNQPNILHLLSEVRKIAIMLALLTGLLFSHTALAADIARFEAESMSLPTGGTTLSGAWAQANCSGGVCAKLEDDGTATKSITTTTRAEEIRVIAQRGASSTTGVIAINVSVDGVAQAARVVDQLPADSSMQAYVWIVSVPAGKRTIGVIGSDLAGANSLIFDVVSLDNGASPPADADGVTEGQEVSHLHPALEELLGPLEAPKEDRSSYHRGPYLPDRRASKDPRQSALVRKWLEGHPRIEARFHAEGSGVAQPHRVLWWHIFRREPVRRIVLCG